MSSMLGPSRVRLVIALKDPNEAGRLVSECQGTGAATMRHRQTRFAKAGSLVVAVAGYKSLRGLHWK